jgi:hypothetical protein
MAIWKREKGAEIKRLLGGERVCRARARVGACLTFPQNLGLPLPNLSPAALLTHPFPRGRCTGPVPSL